MTASSGEHGDRRERTECVDVAALALEYARKVEAGTATDIEVTTLVSHLVVLNEDLPGLLDVRPSVFAEQDEFGRPSDG